MDWASLSKEKKQKIFLVAAWVIGGVFALYYFVWSPYVKRRAESVAELSQLTAKIKQADATTRGEAKLRAEYAFRAEEFNHAVENYIVPRDNPLSWVTEKIYATARRVGIDVQTVAEVGLSSPYWEEAIKSERSVKPYSVRVVTECSYQQLIDLVAALEESNPALCVTEIIISSLDSTPEKHMLNLTLEWPIWGRELKLGVVNTNIPPGGG
jgi:hypothetical protein